VISGVTGNNFAMYGSTNNPLAYKSVATAFAADGVFGNGTAIEKSTAWGIRGAFNHNWNATWSTSVFGSYTSVSWGDAGRNLICSGIDAIAIGNAAQTPTVCNPDFSIAQLGTVTRWTPVKGLTFSGEVMYTWLDQKHEGVIAVNGPGALPAANYEFKNQGTLTLGVRAQRNF